IYMVQKTKTVLGINFIQRFLGTPNNRKFSYQSICIGNRFIFLQGSILIGYPKNLLALHFNIYPYLFGVRNNNSSKFMGMRNGDELAIGQMWFARLIVKQIVIHIALYRH